MYILGCIWNSVCLLSILILIEQLLKLSVFNLFYWMSFGSHIFLGQQQQLNKTWLCLIDKLALIILTSSFYCYYSVNAIMIYNLAFILIIKSWYNKSSIQITIYLFYILLASWHLGKLVDNRGKILFCFFIFILFLYRVILFIQSSIEMVNCKMVKRKSKENEIV